MDFPLDYGSRDLGKIAVLDEDLVRTTDSITDRESPQYISHPVIGLVMRNVVKVTYSTSKDWSKSIQAARTSR